NSKKGHNLDEKLAHNLDEKLATVLKGRAEEVKRLYDAGIEEFQKSIEIQDLMTATYSNE
ncbi:TMV resistance protein N-like, partial [Trifolium medium]|nr:TMV resistance protein N-like [Trifolium medium]